MALQAGQIFGNYRIVRLLGEGGFGEVYLAENPLIKRRVAVKVLHAALAQNAELVRRFLNEARAASAIRHPNIIDVFDAGVTPEGAPYILMEFLEGVSLQKRLADLGRLTPPQVLDIAGQAGAALTAAHGAGIVHRDLKPENIFLVPDPATPSGERVKVLDFGIAKIKFGGSRGGTVKTQTGLIMGSPAYMSPEQCKDSADVDLRSDIYSFAVIVYEMMAGRTPHVAASGTELLVMHLTETPRPLREWAADVPAYVEEATMRALARDRDDRFDTMASFMTALHANAAGSTAVLDSSWSSAKQPASPAAAPSRGERVVSLPASTTFSRATGEVDVPESDKHLVRATHHQRWPMLIIASAAAAGLVLFLLARPSRDSAPSASSGVATSAASAVAPVRETPRENAAPVAPPSKPDAAVATPSVAKLPAAGMRAVAPETNTWPAAKKKFKRSVEDEWIGH